MANEFTLIEAVKLAAGDCRCLFTFSQLFNKLLTIGEYNKKHENAVRTIVTRLIKAGEWKKIGTTKGKTISVYCTNPDVPDIERPPADPLTKTITKLDADLPLKKVLSLLENYLNELVGQEMELTNQTLSLQAALADKDAACAKKLEDKERELTNMKASFQKAIALYK